MKKENTASSLRHLNAVLASTACFAAKLLLVLTRCPILVVPGLELPHQQKQMNYANHKYACSIVQVSQIPTRIEQNPQKNQTQQHPDLQHGFGWELLPFFTQLKLMDQKIVRKGSRLQMQTYQNEIRQRLPDHRVFGCSGQESLEKISVFDLRCHKSGSGVQYFVQCI